MNFPDVTTSVHSRVRSDPDAAAIVDGDREHTYRELWEAAERVALRLREVAVQPGDLVAIRSGRCGEAIPAMLGTWLAGAGHLVVDPGTPPVRAGEMLETARPRALVTTVTGSPGEPLVDASMAPGAAPASRSPAYCVFTSGSTGAPKAVLVGRPALAWHCAALGEHYGLSPRDRVLQAASLTFDVAGEEIWPTLARGATVVLLPGDLGGTSYAAFGEFLRTARITVCNLPSSYFAGWAGTAGDADRTVPSLRLVVAGSESLPAGAAWRWTAHAGNPPLVNAYGTTETTITSVVGRVGPPRGDTQTVALGHPLPGVRVRIVDAALRPVPDGTRGELLVGGAGLADGYLGDAALTEARFVELDGERWYRTGDRVTWTPDGLAYEGRDDDQVKLRGRRVEPAEVVAAVLALEGVTDARVLVVDGQLVACVCGVSTVDESQIRDALHSRLPAYLVPSSVLRFTTLPKTPGGKVDQGALRAAALDRLRGAGAGAGGGGGGPNCGLTVADLVTICRDILQVPDVTADSDFFAAGGTSLHAARLASTLIRRLSLPVPLDMIFAHPRLGDLATAVEALGSTRASPNYPHSS